MELQSSSRRCLGCWGLPSLWPHPLAGLAARSPQPGTPDPRGGGRLGTRQLDRKVKALLISERDRPLGFSLHLPFHQQEGDESPGKRCPRGAAPLTRSPSRGAAKLTDTPRLQGSCQVSRSKEEASSSVQKPLLVLCLLFMLLPLPLPNYHPVKLHSCRDLHLQPAGFNPTSHHWC